VTRSRSPGAEFCDFGHTTTKTAIARARERPVKARPLGPPSYHQRDPNGAHTHAISWNGVGSGSKSETVRHSWEIEVGRLMHYSSDALVGLRVKVKRSEGLFCRIAAASLTGAVASRLTISLGQRPGSRLTDLLRVLPRVRVMAVARLAGLVCECRSLTIGRSSKDSAHA